MRGRHLLAVALAAAAVTVACEMREFLARRSASASVALPGPAVLAAQIPDPPARVFRIRYVRGAISFQGAGTDRWSRAELNRPIVEGETLWTDTAARLELDLGSAAVRLDSRTSFDLLKFDDSAVQARVVQGSLGATVRRLAPGDTVEIDTPNAAVTLLTTGVYRVDVDRSMDTTFVTVRTGSAEVSGTHLDFTVRAGQRANVVGPDAMEYGIRSVPALEQFDEFCDLRDRREQRAYSATSQYVAEDVIGSQDLEESGTWRVDAERGPVWRPNSLPANWAPYRFGHWSWIEPWGWTWIDDATWGFAPFHYGRWVYLNGAWNWVPGPRHVRPVYAPALVVFAGGGRQGFHYHYWIGTAGIAWLPLAVGEDYSPPYRCSQNYLTRINLGNDSSHGDFGNRSVEGAVTAVPRDVFLRGQSIGAAAVPVDAAAPAIINETAPPVAPTEESLSPRTHFYMPRPPEGTMGATVVGRRAPGPKPVAFRDRKALLDAHPGRPLDQNELEMLRKKAEAQPERLDVRHARLGVLERERITPPIPVRSSEEVARERSADSRRLHAVQLELRRAQAGH